jgi:hypothetical protein
MYWWMAKSSMERALFKTSITFFFFCSREFCAITNLLFCKIFSNHALILPAVAAGEIVSDGILPQECKKKIYFIIHNHHHGVSFSSCFDKRWKWAR